MTGRRNIYTRVASLIILAVVAMGPAAGLAQDKIAQAAPETQPAPEAQAAVAPAPAAQGELAVPVPVAEEQPAPAAQTYTINQGDTLWDIANALFRDPFLWPLIWKSNPSITNPDLIYPGNSLAIPSLGPVERAMSAPAEAAPVKEEKALVEKPAPADAPVPPPAAEALPEEPAAEAPFAPRAATEPEAAAPEETAKRGLIIMPEEAPVPVVDKYTMISAGFVNDMETDDEITATADGKSIVGYDDVVYISVASRPDVKAGDRFLIYEPLDVVEHPVTEEPYGRLIKILGILKVTEKGEEGTYTARITFSFDAAKPGSLLTPYVEPTLLYNGGKKGKEVSGTILEVTDRRTINAQTDIVYIDKGQADGVEPGDRYTILATPEDSAAAPKLLGELQVFLVKERTATALVRKSLDAIVRGDRFVSKK